MAALLALAAGALLACLWVTDRVLWQHESIGFLGVYTARLLLLAVAAGSLLAAFAVSVGWPSRSLLARRFHVAGFSTALIVLLLEAVFMYVPRTHNVGYTLGTTIWWQRYWGHENSLGYRDVEHVRVDGKRTVFLLGDSFTAGHGIADVADRFGNVLAAQRADLHVLNLGRCGDDTPGEFTRLQQHPLHPDLVVLQYYPNDIDAAARRFGHTVPQSVPYEDLPSVKMRYLVRASFLANFAYWQMPHDDCRAYDHYLDEVHADERVTAAHLQEVAQFCDWSDSHRVPLVVLLLPLMEDLEWSRKATAEVKALLLRRHVPVLDAADLLADLSREQRMVNSHDGHASVLVNHRIGEALAHMLPHTLQ